MRKIEGPEIVELEERVFDLMKDVYAHSGGEYPALEWAKNRPVPGEDGWESDFESIYRPFLRYRLEEDVDMLLAEENAELKGMIGIKYTHTGSFEGYRRLFSYSGVEMPDNAAFLEMLAVSPKYRGNGLGKRLLNEALRITGEMGKRTYGVSFPGLQPALSIYESLGARIIVEVKDYSWDEEDEPADYVIIEF